MGVLSLTAARDGEPVDCLAHDRHQNCFQSRISRQPVIEFANRARTGVSGMLVEDTPSADDIVGKDQTAGPGELERVIQLDQIAFLVGIDEDEVERSLIALDHFAE